MAKKDRYYFDHDYTARNDDKILQLRAKYGAEGYGVFWMLIESMAENENGQINSSLMAGLSLSYGLAIDKLEEIIKYCISIGLFYKENGFLYSKRLLGHKEFRKERSQSGKRGAENKWKSQRDKRAEFVLMAEFFSNKCVRCEGGSGLKNVEKDHIIPTYQGGPDDITNYQPLCAKCNSSKGPENIDWRLVYCKKHGLVMPKEWLSHRSPNAKEIKGDNSIVKDIIVDDRGLCYNIQKFLLERSAIDFDAVCIASPIKEKTKILEVLEKYHLYVVENAGYPKQPVQLIAGFKKWLINEKNYSKNGRTVTTSIGQTFEPD